MENEPKEILTKEVLLSRAALLATESSGLDFNTGRKNAVVTFHLNKCWYGVPAEYVVEAVKLRKVTPVPGIPDFIVGVINLRGNIMGVIDTKKVLSLPVREENTVRQDGKLISCSLIIIKVEGIEAGFLVDSVEGVTEIDPAGIEPPLSTLEHSQAQYITGEIRIEGRLLVLLNICAVLNSTEIKMLRERREDLSKINNI